MTETKRMRVFAGPNGSGKSTVKEMLPTSYLGHYLNPDELERQLNDNPVFPVEAFNFGNLDLSAVKTFFVKHPLIEKANLQSNLAELEASNSALLFKNVAINSYIAAVLTDWLRRMCIQSGQSFTFETVMSSADNALLISLISNSFY